MDGRVCDRRAYSLAMLLAEHAETLDQPPRIQVFATDIDEAALAFARDGLYPHAAAAEVAPERVERFFTREVGGVRVAKALRELVLFAVHNVLKAPPFSRIDLLSCRNLLIYLERDVQGRIYELFHYALRPGGFLFLGTFETAEGAGPFFTVVGKKRHLYRRQDASNTPQRYPVVPLPGPLSREQLHRRTLQGPKEATLDELNRSLLLRRYAPPGAIVDAGHRVVFLVGGISRYLWLVEGAATQDLLKMVHPDLRLELQTALHRAGRTGGAIETRPEPVEVDGAVERVRLVVQPVTGDERFHGYAQVLFEVALEMGGPTDVGDNAIATHLYRIAQEAVTNAARHAGASLIRIRLHGDEAHLILAVEDDGVGIPEDVLPHGEGLGLRTMRYRADLIGAALSVGRRPESGTVVTCTLRRASLRKSLRPGGDL